MEYSPGLRGVIAGETAISTVGKEGTSLRYRGYDATELTSKNTYEEVASLILTDSIEDKNFKKSFSKYYLETSKDAKLNELLGEIKEKLHPMDVVRTIVSYKGELTTLRKKSLDNEDKTELSARITAIVCYIIASYHQEACDELDKQYLVASSLLPNGTSKEKLEALDDMLILYAEHGFNASTFATRVTASTRADLTGAIVSNSNIKR
jgi:2-methylcitrate synthase